MKLSKIDRKKGVFPMANRIMLNQTSYHGAGAIEEIANEAKAHAFRKAFVCSDPALIKFGVTAKVTAILDREGLAYEIYSDIKANPTIENVKNGVAAVKASGADYIIAIGGGSSMDTSKAIGIIILGWGIVQVGMSIQSHDASQRTQGLLCLFGGLLITFAKEILTLITG